MNKSESIQKIAQALSNLQSEIKNPANTANNPFFNSKYAPLPDILNESRPLLAKHGLSVLQSPSGDGQNISITTLLMHTSGEWIETEPLTLKADKATAQGAGSAITYARRYALSAVLGISSEDDDDGNHASNNNQNKTQTNVPDSSKKGVNLKENTVSGHSDVPNEGFEKAMNAMETVYVCSECPSTITEAEHKYSIDKFGNPLCRPCQKKAK
ncbi:MAG: ERF family protein [Deltaproteobacteria bacterium]